jgi:hypothetical protein
MYGSGSATSAARRLTAMNAKAMAAINVAMAKILSRVPSLPARGGRPASAEDSSCT